MVLDPELEQRIAAIVEPLSRRWRNIDPEAMRAGTRKQAVVPEGAAVLEPAGTAPGVVVPPADGRAGPTVVVLPGPPRELQSMWPAAVATDEFAAAVGERQRLHAGHVRLFGIPESEIAETLRVAEGRVAGLDAARGDDLPARRRGRGRRPPRAGDCGARVRAGCAT